MAPKLKIVSSVQRTSSPGAKARAGSPRAKAKAGSKTGVGPSGQKIRAARLKSSRTSRTAKDWQYLEEEEEDEEQLLEEELLEEEVVALQRCFGAFDTTGSGKLTRREMGDLIMLIDAEQSLGIEELLRLLDEVDTNGDGQIDYAEFSRWVLRAPCRVRRVVALPASFLPSGYGKQNQVTETKSYAVSQEGVQRLDGSSGGGRNSETQILRRGEVGVRVCKLTGEEFFVCMNEESSVKQLKLKIKDYVRRSVPEMILISGSAVLGDSQLLTAVERESDGSVYLTVLVRHEDFCYWLQEVKKNGLNLANAPPAICSDEVIVLAAIAQNGLSIQFAAHSMKSDPHFITEAVKANPSAFTHAHMDLRGNRAFVLELVKQNGCALVGATEDLKRDRTIVLEAVKENEYAILHADVHLREDAEFVAHMAKHNCGVSRLCAGRLR